MGCLFSSAATETPAERHRKEAANESQPLLQETATKSMALPQQNTNTPKRGQGNFTPRVLGTSYTDMKLREQQNFSNVVQQARQAFIDISTQQRVQVTPLTFRALKSTAKHEKYLSTILVPNIRGGFFDAQIPRTVFTSVDYNPESTAANSVNAIVDVILSGIDLDAAELAVGCANEVCMGLGEGAIPISQEALVITLSEFEENYE